MGGGAGLVDGARRTVASKGYAAVGINEVLGLTATRQVLHIA
jgi:hypothetical protein